MPAPHRCCLHFCAPCSRIPALPLLITSFATTSILPVPPQPAYYLQYLRHPSCHFTTVLPLPSVALMFLADFPSHQCPWHTNDFAPNLFAPNLLPKHFKSCNLHRSDDTYQPCTQAWCSAQLRTAAHAMTLHLAATACGPPAACACHTAAAAHLGSSTSSNTTPHSACCASPSMHACRCTLHAKRAHVHTHAHWFPADPTRARRPGHSHPFCCPAGPLHSMPCWRSPTSPWFSHPSRFLRHDRV